MLEVHEENAKDKKQEYSFRESNSAQTTDRAPINEATSIYQLRFDHKNGIIFDSSAIHITGTASFPVCDISSYSIVVLDDKSDKVARIDVRREKAGNLHGGSFSWNLKSSSGSYAKSGRYRMSLTELLPDGVEVERCSGECMVADTLEILSTTNLLKRSKIFSDPTCSWILAGYADIIRDIETRIIEGLKENRFDEPYFVARTTAGFIQQIYSDIQISSTSQFRRLIEAFVSKNPRVRERSSNDKLGLLALFDFLVNYMADPEDRARAAAMVQCEYRNFTANDRSVILRALASGIFPHCFTIPVPVNVIGKRIFSAMERLVKVGIKYVCAKHIDKSISICRATLPKVSS